jgi:glycosyltransferase involved in cell wall biosynthesis
MLLSSKAKIAVFIPTLGGGGAERVMLNLAKILKEHYKVSLVVSKAEGPYLPDIQALDLELVDLGSRRPRTSLVPFAKYAFSASPDVVISALEPANIAAAVVRLMKGYRLILTEHSTPSAHYPGQRDVLLRNYPRIARIFYPLADKIVAVSEGVREDMIRVYKLPSKKVRVIYNPVINSGFFEKLNAEVSVSPLLDEKNKRPLIIAAGRLDFTKGFDVLLCAVRQVIKVMSVSLIIFGEGPERAKLESMAEELGIAPYVRMPGFTPYLPAYLRQANLFVLSSRWEGLPTVLIEALAAGVPVVSTDCPSGPREILEGGKWGKLVPVENSDALAHAILEQLRAPLVPPAESWVRFTEETIAQEWLSLVEEVLSRRGRS